MSSTLRALAPRDRASAARTLVGAALFSFLATTGWEAVAAVTRRGTSTPASAAQAIGLALVMVLMAWVCRRAPERVPLWIYPCIALLAPLMTVVVALSSHDGSAAGQLGLVYPVIYAAAHFRPGFAWSVTALAAGAAAAIALGALPTPSAVADIVVMAPALAMITLVLLTLAEHHERLNARLAEQAAADPLTGLATRRELEAAARRALEAPVDRHRRQVDRHPAIGLMVIDIDNFKHLNDRYGHPAGDSALVHVSRLVRGSVRDTDTVARLGGDELAVLLAGSPADVEARAHAIRETVERCPPPSLSDVQLTVSIGIANGHARRSSFESLYAAADGALYQAKAAGRNNVIAVPTTTG